MDPKGRRVSNACLRTIDDHIRHGETSGADASCADLLDWLDKGGFEPRWSQYPVGANYFRARHHRQLDAISSREAATILEQDRQEYDRCNADYREESLADLIDPSW